MNHLQPLRLSPDNFTPLSRTPWAGQRIAARYKNQFTTSDKQKIGEAWEVSCDISFPSTCIDFDRSLQQMIDQYPNDLLGSQYANSGTCEILVKLIDTDECMSLQIHPHDDTPGLLKNECGKPESWYILDAEEGAGIFLGFNQKLTIDKLYDLLTKEQIDIASVLQFIPVKRGDYFEIAPGVPHAIGAGVTLLEPQRICRGKSGKTYRMWDWNRRFDEAGLPSAQGKPRDLHIEQSLALIDFERCFGEKFIAELRRTPTQEKLSVGQLDRHTFPANPYYQITILQSHTATAFNLQQDDSFALLIPLSTTLSCGNTIYPIGQPIFIPARSTDPQWRILQAGEVALITPPYGAKPL